MRPGYEQTEVGVIPEEWGLDRIGNLASITTGAKNTQDKVEEGEFPFFVRSANVEHINTYSYDGEAVLTAGDGVGTGKVFHYINGKFDFHQRVYKISDFVDELDGYYFYQHFRTHFHSRIMSMTAKSSVDSVRMEMIADMLVPLPPLHEQRAIANALNDVDALIRSLDQLIAKKRDLKQAAMQQLLTGRKRLPGFQGDWELRRLGELGQCLRGVSYRGNADLSPYDTDRAIRLLRANNIQTAAVVTNDLQFVNSERVSPAQVMLDHDILICMANGSKDLVGKAGMFGVKDGHCYTFGAFMGCFRTIPHAADPTFVYSLFHTIRYRQQMNGLLAGSSINNLRPSAIESLEFNVPGREEQTAIAEVLSDMDAEIAALERRREKTRALKEGMMQELLTGRIRLV